MADTRQEAPFWMVYTPEGKNPHLRHAEFGIANAEANRLAEANPDTPFTVLKSIRTYVKTNMIEVVHSPMRKPNPPEPGYDALLLAIHEAVTVNPDHTILVDVQRFRRVVRGQ